MNPNFSLDELLLFHEVLSTGSLTKAAANLRVAKSTISRRLQSLEKQLGAMLLKRHSRGLVPTEIGQELYARCERIVHEIADLGSVVEGNLREVRGTLRVSIPTEFGTGWLGKAVADFALAYPELRVDVEIALNPPNLLEDSFDLAISFGQLKDSRLTFKRLASFERSIFASADYLGQYRIPRRIEDLNDHPFIVTDVQQREGTLMLRAAGSRRRITIRHRVTVNSMRLARELVLCGVGLAVLPHRWCERYVASGELVPVLPDWRCPPVQVSAVVLAREGIPRKTRAFLDFVTTRLSAAMDT